MSAAAGGSAGWFKHSETAVWLELVNLKMHTPVTQRCLSWTLALED